MFTDRQKMAWDNPCVIGTQTEDKRFHKDYRYGGFDLSSMLTLNFGME